MSPSIPPLPNRLVRQLAGDCVERGCPLKAADGSDYCAPHRDKKRARDAAYVTRKRSRRRAAQECIDCGKKSKYRRCPRCYKLSRGVGDSARGVGDSPPAKRGHYKTEVYSDGATRTRFVGQPHRGGPTRVEQDASLLRRASKATVLGARFDEAFPGIRAQFESLPRIQRAEAWQRFLYENGTGPARARLEVFAELGCPVAKAMLDEGCGDDMK